MAVGYFYILTHVRVESLWFSWSFFDAYCLRASGKKEGEKDSISLFMSPPLFLRKGKSFPLPHSQLYIPCQEICTHWALCHMFPITSCKESWESMDLAFESLVVGGGKGEGCREWIWGQAASVC